VGCLQTTLSPAGPYDLRLVTAGASDATRRVRDGVFTTVFETASGPAYAAVSQRSDGRLRVGLTAACDKEALEQLRFVLSVDDDHTEFLRRFANDPLIGVATRLRRGLRPLRTATVVHALLRALSGQLIAAQEARRIESRVIRNISRQHGDFWLPPTREALSGTTPAALARLGLISKKGSAAVRLSRSFDLERLHSAPTSAVVARICRERTLGPWSAGVICLQGLGRREHGLVGDLGLIKLCSARLGREATQDDTAELLEPYGEWAGYASMYIKASGKVTSAPVSALARQRPGTHAA